MRAAQSLWRTATAVVASVRTRLTEWMLVPKGLAQQILDRPEMPEQHAREQVDVKRRYLRQRDILEAVRLEKAASVNAALPA